MSNIAFLTLTDEDVQELNNPSSAFFDVDGFINHHWIVDRCTDLAHNPTHFFFDMDPTNDRYEYISSDDVLSLSNAQGKDELLRYAYSVKNYMNMIIEYVENK